MKKLILVFVFLISCNSKKNTQLQTDFNYTNLPQNKEQFIINDYSNLFTKPQKNSLTKKLYNYENTTTRQIVVVTVDSISPYTNIQKYATDIGQYWGVGQKEKDNGLVIVLSNKLRKIGIATGYGTEKILTDSICSKIIQNAMIPHFKNNEFYKGANAGIDSILAIWSKH